MRLTKVVTGVLLATGAAGAYAGQFKNAITPSSAVEDQYIVILKDDTVQENEGIFSSQANLKAVQMANDSLSTKYQAQVSQTFKSVVKGGVYQMSEAQAQKLAQDPSVKLVEQDQMVSISATQNNAIWGLDRVDQRDLPLSGSYTYNTTASNVNAYIIDTGILENHSEFGNRFAGGYDFIDNDNTPDDCNGHGTHVAGTVGGSTYGVAKGVSLYGLKVLGCNGRGPNSGIISAMDWVADNHSKPAVANMSLGGGASYATDNAVQSLTDSGVTVVVAAGNDGQDACNYSPGRATSAITVGSTNRYDERSIFPIGSSNYGSCLDIWAPGSNIKSAWSNGGTNTIGGTSMASPHVAGAAALYLAENPNATPSQVTQVILDAATPGKVSDAKSGSPNLLLYSLFDGSNPDPGNELQNGVSVSFSGAQDSETDFTFEVPSDASSVSFDMSGGSGDADIYVRFGSAPTTSTYDCRPYLNGNNESCDFNAQAGTYYVMVRGYSDYSNVNLVANHDGSSTNPPPSGGNETIKNISGSAGEWAHYYLDVPAGMSSLTASISGGSGDADLYVRRGSKPTTSTYDCRPYQWGNDETCDISNPAEDRYYISLLGYQSYSDITLNIVWK